MPNVSLWLFGKEIATITWEGATPAEEPHPDVVTRSIGFAAAELADEL